MENKTKAELLTENKELAKQVRTQERMIQHALDHINWAFDDMYERAKEAFYSEMESGETIEFGYIRYVADQVADIQTARRILSDGLCACDQEEQEENKLEAVKH